MFETFRAFDRKNKIKQINEGLQEDFDLKNPAIDSSNGENKKNNFAREANIDKNDALLKKVNKPEDVLKLPSKLRAEGLKILKEKIAQRYYNISRIQTEILKYIEDKYKLDNFNFSDLKKQIIKLATKYNLADREGLELINELINNYRSTHADIERCQGKSDQELISLGVKNNDFDESKFNKIKVERSPLSINLILSNQDDFKSFITGQEDKKDKYQLTQGISYYRNNIPFTASYRDNILKHEYQHKKFKAITGNDLAQSKIYEMNTRDELLAFYASGSKPQELRNDLLIYKFWEEAKLEKDEYEKLLIKSVAVIASLEKLNFSREDIIGLLAREPLQRWPRIKNLSGFSGTNFFREIAKEEKNKKVVANISKNEELLKNKESNVSAILQEKLSQPLKIKKKSNAEGLLYEKIDENKILEIIKKQLNESDNYYFKEKVTKKNIYLPKKIDKPGEYDILVRLKNFTNHFKLIIEED